jgi:hypothetical protein
MGRSERSIRQDVSIGQFSIGRVAESDRLLWARHAVEKWLQRMTWAPMADQAPENQ